MTVDYGTTINDLPSIRDSVIDTVSLRRHLDILQADVVTNTRGQLAEDHLSRLVRFKLYSIEADEVVNFIALARINPVTHAFDPHFYAYGGAYLYPLGAFYWLLATLGVMELPTLPALLQQPDLVDTLYIAGRMWIVVAFALSSLLLWFTLQQLTTRRIAHLGQITYLLMPASIIFSHVLKPHWYALLWVNLALACLVILWRRRKASWLVLSVLAAAVGLAVGSSLTLSLFAAVTYAVLVVAAKQRLITPWTVVAVILISVAVFGVSNPYVWLNWQVFRGDVDTVGGQWYVPQLALRPVALFVRNSMFSGFGSWGLAVLAACLWQLVKPSFAYARVGAVIILATVVLVGSFAAPVAHWHTAYRIVPFLLPFLVLYGCLVWRSYPWILVLLMVLTVTQAVPLKLAYFDEDSPTYSTRLQAAAWINSHVAPGSTLCPGTRYVAPYNTPPFDLRKTTVGPPCDYYVHLAAETAADVPAGLRLAARFEPRLTGGSRTFVYGHVNPIVSVYRSPEFTSPP